MWGGGDGERRGEKGKWKHIPEGPWRGRARKGVVGLRQGIMGVFFRVIIIFLLLLFRAAAGGGGCVFGESVGLSVCQLSVVCGGVFGAVILAVYFHFCCCCRCHSSTCSYSAA